MSQEKIPVGVIGLGMVGKPLLRWFAGDGEEKKGERDYFKGNGYVRGKNLFCYDTNPMLGYFDDYNLADVIFVCCPTPPNTDGSCNTQIVESVVNSVKDGKIVVIKSTVVPGTTEILQEIHPHKYLIFNGEYLTESQPWSDFLHPARQVVGFTKQSRKFSVLVLSLLPRGYFESPLKLDYSGIEITATEAEVIKYASNVFGACKVVFGNMFYDYCSALEASYGVKVDYENVRKAIAADQRINSAWLGEVRHQGYRGFGGFCFPKDLNAHIQALKFHLKKIKQLPLKCLIEKGIKIFEAVWDYNEELLRQKGLTISSVSKHEKEIVV